MLSSIVLGLAVGVLSAAAVAGSISNNSSRMCSDSDTDTPGRMATTSSTPSRVLKSDVIRKYVNVRSAIFPFSFMFRLADPESDK